MRDLIWTIIILWFVYRIVNIFRQTKQAKQPNTGSGPSQAFTPPGNSHPKSRLDTEGEYVDFEEIR